LNLNSISSSDASDISTACLDSAFFYNGASSDDKIISTGDPFLPEATLADFLIDDFLSIMGGAGAGLHTLIWELVDYLNVTIRDLPLKILLDFSNFIDLNLAPLSLNFSSCKPLNL